MSSVSPWTLSSNPSSLSLSRSAAERYDQLQSVRPVEPRHRRSRPAWAWLHRLVHADA